MNSGTFARLENKERYYPLFCADEYFRAMKRSERLNFVAIDRKTLTENSAFDLQRLDATVVLVVDTMAEHGMAEERDVIRILMERSCPLSGHPEAQLRQPFSGAVTALLLHRPGRAFCSTAWATASGSRHRV